MRLRNRVLLPVLVGLLACTGGPDASSGDGADAADSGETADGTPFDLVVLNGRVIDPASGLDAVRHLGIREGRIARVSETPLEAPTVIDASGLVVAPGFVDLHRHGQSDEAYDVMVRDGVTSAFELEVGVGDIDAWYAEREGGTPVHYGAAIGHIPVRMDVFGDPGQGLVPAGAGGSASAGPEELDEIEARLREGLERGAVAVGFGSAYTPGADMGEITRMFEAAADYGAPVAIHMRGGPAGLDSTIAAAAEAGAALHVVHVNSSGGDDLTAFLDAIAAARAAGQDVTTEAYPYGAGMTGIESALFEDWESWPDERFGDFQWTETGERLTRESFERYRAQGGYVVIHGRSEEQTREAITHPLTMVASDGGLLHPRGAGTYAKVLAQYVRDERALTLVEALRKMTLEPARRLEARVPDMARKGRISEGADADLTLFDPETVVDRSSYTDPAVPSAGIPWVIVGGVVVVEDGELTGARPGRAIRAP